VPVLVALTLALSSSPASADGTIRPRYPDLTPGDGFMDPGSHANPHELRRDDGSRAVIHPSTPDLNPGDGFMEPGSYSNPYRIQEQPGYRYRRY